MLFADRADAGRRLAKELARFRGEDVVVVGLPRGGMPVAAEVARALGAPLDVMVVRKLGVPSQPELPMGALGERGVEIVDRQVTQRFGVSEPDLDEVVDRERADLRRQVQRYRRDRPPVPLSGRSVIVVDDGVATGSTGRAACQVARAMGAYQVVLAVPVAPARSAAALGRDADDVVCLEAPDWFIAIGQFYAHFPPVTDDEVAALLRMAAAPPSPGGAQPPPGGAQPPPGGWQPAPSGAGPARDRG